MNDQVGGDRECREEARTRFSQVVTVVGAYHGDVDRQIKEGNEQRKSQGESQATNNCRNINRCTEGRERKNKEQIFTKLSFSTVDKYGTLSENQTHDSNDLLLLLAIAPNQGKLTSHTS